MLIGGLAFEMLDSLLPPGLTRDVLPTAVGQVATATALIFIYPDEFILPKSKSNTYAARAWIVIVTTLAVVLYGLPVLL